MMTLYLCLLLCLICGLSDGKPNIIILLADDLGWNDLSFHGSPQIPTPNLDSLAQNGIILNNYYVCPICSPSRGALMTGQYPIHIGLQHDVIYVNQPWGVPLSKTLLPQHLRTLGYETHAVGKVCCVEHSVTFYHMKFNEYKPQYLGCPLFFGRTSGNRNYLEKFIVKDAAIFQWHLGFFRKEYTPTFRGFNSHYGYWGGKEDYYDHTQQMGEMWGLDFHHNMKSVTENVGKYSTELFANQAAKIIQEHNTTKPLFLYVAYQSVHSANSYATLQAPKEYIERFPYIQDKNRRIFAAMVSAMDDSVKTIVDSLRSKNMLKNSIILFSTDNGGPAAGFNDNAASNWPLRGVKATLWEGGVRGISFIWSPLLKASGRTSRDLIHITDWLPTLYYAAGGNTSELAGLDGFNVWNTLSNNQPSPRSEVLLNIDPINKVSALRVGNYKVIQGTVYGGQWDGWYGPSGREDFTSITFQRFFRQPVLDSELLCGDKPKNATDCFPGKSPCLFDVEKDPCEFNNLADKKPDVLNGLLKRLSFYQKSAVPPGNKPVDPRSNPKYHNYQWINWMDYV